MKNLRRSLLRCSLQCPTKGHAGQNAEQHEEEQNSRRTIDCMHGNVFLSALRLKNWVRLLLRLAGWRPRKQVQRTDQQKYAHDAPQKIVIVPATARWFVRFGDRDSATRHGHDPRAATMLLHCAAVSR